MCEEKMTALSSRLTEMGIMNSYGCSGGRAWISAKINGLYDLSVRAEIDDDDDDDMVVFSLRLNGELLMLNYDNVTEFHTHLGAFMRAIGKDEHQPDRGQGR